MSFNSQENKGLLWNTLVEAKMFDGIDNSKVGEIKNHFEMTINNISTAATKEQQKGRVFQLVDLNKQFMTNFSQYLMKHKQNNSQELTEVYTSQQRSEKRASDFNYAVKQRQVQREISQPTPKEIDFTKQLDEEPITDMDAQLQKMMAERDLVNVDLDSNDKKKAETWINNGQERSLVNEIVEPAPISDKHVSFADTTTIDTNLDNLNDPINARIQLNKEEHSPQNVLSRLKTVTNNTNSNNSDNDINSKLSELITLVKQQTELIKSLVNK